MGTFRVVVAGLRRFTEYGQLRAALDTLLVHRLPDVAILSGCGPGTDALAASYAKECGPELVAFPIDYAKYRTDPAGERNEWMVAGADAAVVVWDPTHRFFRPPSRPRGYRNRSRPSLPAADEEPPMSRLCRFVPLTALFAVAPVWADDPPTRLTAHEDHKRMMDLLGIKELRRGADGNPKSPNAANVDESKATPYPDLPDPLTLKNGQKVTTAEMWWGRRRPEIVEDFDREVYGRVPKDTPRVTWEVTSTDKEKVVDVPVVTKRLLGRVDNSAYPEIKVEIQLTLTTPEKAAGPVPVILEFGFAFPPGFTPKGPTPKGGPGWQQQVLEKGWGYAVLVPTTVQPDTGGQIGKDGVYRGLTTGVIGLCNKGRPRKPDDWGALRAWAWGASRALDYFETDPAVDAKRVGIEGLSRYGKAAAVAMAYDRRFAIGFIGSSGAGGLKLHRRDYGEKVENVAGPGEYHWMAGNYLKYAGPLTAKDLPVDAHELVALCAPRPVFISVGSLQVEGGWVDAKGMFLAGVHAGPVYELLGKKGLGTAEFPKQETALTDGEVAFRQHAGGHTTGPNWPTFLAFADRYFNPKP